ncbi:MAG: ABC transporter substrate-binding protein [Halothece sp.]
MKRRSFLTWLAIFLVSFTFTVSCSPSSSNVETEESNAAIVETAPVKMGYSAWPGWFPWRVAEEQKLFDKNNVNVNLVWFDGYLDSINALAAGQLDANTQTLNDTISSVAAGSDQVIVLVNDNSTGNDKIIVREGINEIADLKGKTVAVEEGTVDHFLLLLGLEKAGLSPNDVEIQPLETGQASAAFVAGKVDAVGVFAPFTTQALQRQGSKELFSSADFPGAIPDHLVVSRQLIDERPEAVQGLVNTWFDTLAFIENNRETAYKAMSEKAGVSMKEYQDYDSGTTIFTLEDNLKAFQSREDITSLYFAADKVSDFLLQNGLIQSLPETRQLFDDQFVKAYAETHSK